MKRVVAWSKAEILSLVAFACWHCALWAAPRPPLPPWPELLLYQWNFDEPYSDLVKKGETAAIDSSVWMESWSGYALSRQGRQVAPIQLPVVSSTGYPLVANASGQATLRWWYCPAWSTGKGPGHDAPLLEMVSATGKDAVTWWTLRVDPAGAALVLSAQTADGFTDLAKAPLNWQAGQWHLLALTYSTTNTVLSIDGQTVATGQGLLAIPTSYCLFPACSLAATSKD